MLARRIVFLLLILAALPAFGQSATIHFYRYKQYVGSALKPSVYCDGVELARIQNGRYIDVQVPAGSHTFYSNDKQAGAIVNVVAGKEYYFRLDLQTGFWKGHFRVDMVEPDQGKYDLSHLKPGDTNMIRKAAPPASE